jgi:copper(I)-binding protein
MHRFVQSLRRAAILIARCAPQTHRARRLFVAAMLTMTSLPAAAQVAVTDAWVRGTVTGQKVTGAFMQLKSPADAALVAVTSPVAKLAEIHEMKQDGGVMRMRAVDKVALPAGKSVEFKPGGYHVMLMDVTGPLKEGDTVPLTLTFEDKAGKKETLEVKARVKALTAADLPAHKH